MSFPARTFLSNHSLTCVFLQHYIITRKLSKIDCNSRRCVHSANHRKPCHDCCCEKVCICTLNYPLLIIYLSTSSSWALIERSMSLLLLPTSTAITVHIGTRTRAAASELPHLRPASSVSFPMSRVSYPMSQLLHSMPPHQAFVGRGHRLGTQGYSTRGHRLQAKLASLTLPHLHYRIPLSKVIMYHYPPKPPIPSTGKMINHTVSSSHLFLYFRHIIRGTGCCTPRTPLPHVPFPFLALRISA